MSEMERHLITVVQPSPEYTAELKNMFDANYMGMGTDGNLYLLSDPQPFETIRDVRNAAIRVPSEIMPKLILHIPLRNGSKPAEL